MFRLDTLWPYLPVVKILSELDKVSQFYARKCILHQNPLFQKCHRLFGTDQRDTQNYRNQTKRQININQFYIPYAMVEEDFEIDFLNTPEWSNFTKLDNIW